MFGRSSCFNLSSYRCYYLMRVRSKHKWFRRIDTEPGKLIASGSKLVRIVKRIWLLDLRCRMQTEPKKSALFFPADWILSEIGSLKKCQLAGVFLCLLFGERRATPRFFFSLVAWLVLCYHFFFALDCFHALYVAYLKKKMLRFRYASMYCLLPLHLLLFPALAIC